jgi:hypothetical protein
MEQCCVKLTCRQIKNMNAIALLPITRTMSFYKESGCCYADIPEFLEQGLGTKANLLMVDGSDSFLDYLSGNGHSVNIKIDIQPFENHVFELIKIKVGLNIELLNRIGHAPVEYGAYYNVISLHNLNFHHVLWLCPVAEYVFKGAYPQHLFIAKI